MRNPINTWSLCRQGIVHLFLLGIGLLAIFLASAWFRGSLKLPDFLFQPSRQGTPTNLRVTVFPEDASILLNDQPFDPNGALVPGDYVIRAAYDGFFPAEENFHVHPNQQNQLTIRLMPMIFVDKIAQHATALGWDNQSSLYFLDISEGIIYKWEENTDAPFAAVNTEKSVYQLVYVSAGNYAFGLTAEGPESKSKLHMINLQTGDITGLLDTGFVSLGSDGETIWGFNNDLDNYAGKPVWSLKPNGSPEFLSLDNSQWAIYGEQLFVDTSSQWLAVEGTKGVAIWEIASGKLLITFENASAPVWIQNPEPGLAFLNTDQSLNFAQANFNWSAIKLLENVQSPITGTPDGTEIIFTRYNPFVGGTSFWAVDTATMGVYLLSEAKTETGSVEQFVVSYDRKKIAFVNQKNELFLVTLEP